MISVAITRLSNGQYAIENNDVNTTPGPHYIVVSRRWLRQVDAELRELRVVDPDFGSRVR